MVLHRSDGFHMPLFKRLFGSVAEASTKPNTSGDDREKRRTSRQLVKPVSGPLSSLSEITASFLRPPVDGAALLEDVTAAVRRHVVLADDFARTNALFVLHAHAHDAARISPVLALTSPVIGCGKTTALAVLAELTPQPLFIGNLTPAGLYRTVNGKKSTLLIDEAESGLLGNRVLLSLLNSGHRRAGARVLRADGIFEVYCPKVIALVGELPAALRDRAISIGLERKRPDETVAPLNAAAIAHLQELSQRAASWAEQQFEKLAAANPVLPAGLNNRHADNWGSLLSIADAAGGRWPDLARSLAVCAMSHAEAQRSPGVALLYDLRAIFRALQIDRLATADIVEMLPDRGDGQWDNYHRGRPITASDIARLLRPFGIRPSTMRFGQTTAKGYLVADFQNAFGRYLSPLPTQAAPAPANVTPASPQKPL